MRKGKIKQPVTKGVAKVPVVLQMEAVECGAAALTMILAYYKKWIPLEKVRADCGVSQRGTNAKNILRAAESYGLEAEGYKYEPEGLKAEGKFPCIIHWDFHHFVVLCGFRKNKAVLVDPARGPLVVSEEEFDASFTGVCLFFSPGSEFMPSGKRKSILRFSLNKIRDNKASFLLIALSTVIASFVGLLAPGFSAVLVDRLLTGENPEWFFPFLYLLGGIALCQVIASWIRAVYSYKANAKVEIVSNAEWVWHILRLPMDFFAQRMAGDIVSRKEKNGEIASRLVSNFAPVIVESGMALFYLLVMLRYHVVLGGIGLLSVIMNFLISYYISQKRVNLTRVISRNSGNRIGMTVSGISMMEIMKASSAENGFFEKWSGYLAAENAEQVRLSQLNIYWGILPKLVNVLSQAVVFMGSVYLCMAGQWTVGMIGAFLGLFTAFLSPTEKIVAASQTFHETRTDMERVEDVMEYPLDPQTQDLPLVPEQEVGKLSGKIEVKDVTFGYAKLDPPLITHFSMQVEPGQRIAIVGASGSGKSTIAKLLSGLYMPWSGEILFDGKPIREINRSIFTGSVAVVDQDIVLFQDTVSNNIKMWDRSIEDFEVILAARDAQIHDNIMQRSGGYYSVLSENGRDLSGGEKQRVEIARVLAQDPTIVIMDEATSALDANTEDRVIQSISSRGITCIMVAHRLSTIRDCDKILVMEKGKIVETGTHAELMAKGGVYYRLVNSE